MVYADNATKAMERGVMLSSILALPLRAKIASMKTLPTEESEVYAEQLFVEIRTSLGELEVG
jgi:vacuolar-type H+-ATPase catalytic subunit A/Vma1